MSMYGNIVFIILTLLITVNFSNEENPCQDYSTKNCDPKAECYSPTPNVYQCRCPKGYRDVSPNTKENPAQICEPIHQVAKSIDSPSYVTVKQCKTKEYTCSPNADCIEKNNLITCKCKDDYYEGDEAHPGRLCLKSNELEIYATPCSIYDMSSCDKKKKEVCLLKNGKYKCLCTDNSERSPDGVCLLNECSSVRLNNCSKNANCIELDDGYDCECNNNCYDPYLKTGKGQKGRNCIVKIDECKEPLKYNVDCGDNSVCVDTDESYYCQCSPGYVDVSYKDYKLRGRKCILAVNECLKKTNDCSENATCTDTPESYTCQCKEGYVDVSTDTKNYPGRICKKPIPEVYHLTKLCNPNNPQCDENEECVDKENNNVFKCECVKNSIRYYDKKCLIYTSCSNNASCDDNAMCVNVLNTSLCVCKDGYRDEIQSPTGKSCYRIVNECNRDNSCGTNARCIDRNKGYRCECLPGFVDVSSSYNAKPGQYCIKPLNECELKFDDCDINAHCIDLLESFECRCKESYIDVSENANLPPGRACTLKTSCPNQKTDLIFLIDGSGSIGSSVFKNEILRFIQNFLDLFDIGLNDTRIGLIQYSDQISHEFNLNQHSNKQSLLKAISNITYLTGLTRTGAAIKQMTDKGFSKDYGARSLSDNVTRVAIVITDGRSQDNVTEAANNARRMHINMFAIGVTDHILDEELQAIAGSRKRKFYVNNYKDLNQQLLLLIQKLACPEPKFDYIQSFCESNSNCNSNLNEICSLSSDGKKKCQCPDGFDRHPITKFCGGSKCDPKLATPCKHPETCNKTMHNTYTCICPLNYIRDQQTGICVSTKYSALLNLDCDHDNEDNCSTDNFCDGSNSNSCDSNKHEKCLWNPSKNHYICQCDEGIVRDPITKICIINKCQTNQHSCHKNATCHSDGLNYSCTCNSGTIDLSPDEPGRICKTKENYCLTHDCSKNAECKERDDGYDCICLPGYIDKSENKNYRTGIVCEKEEDECQTNKHNCSPNAKCIKTKNSYYCQCKPDYIDLEYLSNAGRNCQKSFNACVENNLCGPNQKCVMKYGGIYGCECNENFVKKVVQNDQAFECVEKIDECKEKIHDCSLHADCIDLLEGYLCKCKKNFNDKSYNVINRPGRICRPALIDECKLNKHNCHSNAKCIDLPIGYTCKCKEDFLDKSKDKELNPGRLCVQKKPLSFDECQIQNISSCKTELNEVCKKINGIYKCVCPTNYSRNKKTNKCNAIDYCLIPEIVDCHAFATCKSQINGYTCECNEGFYDISPNRNIKPGRNCQLIVNKCHFESLNNCNENAECVKIDNSYECRCNEGFKDLNPNQPGRLCQKIINECEENSSSLCDKISENVNLTLQNYCKTVPHNCDLNADCINTETSFVCKCKEGYIDRSISESGQNCVKLINECITGNHTCSPEADCYDLDEGYTCICKNGFIDRSKNKQKGRICEKKNFELYNKKPTQSTYYAPPVNNCNETNCKSELGKHCLNDICQCKHDQKIVKEDELCNAFTYTIPILVIRKNEETLNYTAKIGENEEFFNLFKHGLENAFNNTSLAQDFFSVKVLNISNPSDINFHEGLLYYANVSFKTKKAEKDIFYLLLDQIKNNDYQIGNSTLYINHLQKNLLNNCNNSDNSNVVDLTSFNLTELCKENSCNNSLCSSNYTCIVFNKTVSCALNNNTTTKPSSAANLADECGTCLRNGSDYFCSISHKRCEETFSNLNYLFLLLATLFLLLTLCCLLYLCTKCHCFKRRFRAFPWNTLDQSMSSDSGGDYTSSDLYIPRAKLKNSENMPDANALQLAQYLDDGLRIPRARLHDADSLGSGLSEFTIREEIERRIITDVTKTEIRTVTTDDDVVNNLNETNVFITEHNAYNGTNKNAVKTQSFVPNDVLTTNQQNKGVYGHQFDEQERGESVAEFANSQNDSGLRSGRFANSNTKQTISHGNSNNRFLEEHQDDRSIGNYTLDDDEVYDKSILVKRHHEFNPETEIEKFKNEVTTTKNFSTTHYK